MERLAIIGTGIAGMGSAHLLKNKYELTIFEQLDYVGGHTNTITVNENGKTIYMDTGFMVFNFETYPNLCNLFKEIEAPIKKSDMSFSVQHTPSNLEYCGSGLDGLFAQRKNIFNFKYIKMLMEIQRFNKEAVNIIDNPAFQQYSLADFIKHFKFSDDMLWKYLVPMSAAVWSTPMELMLDFPAVTLIRFFKNHGFLGLHTQHQWYTLHNGSQAYREKLIAPFKQHIQLNNAVTKVAMAEGKVAVHTVNGAVQYFDKVVMACHADQALQLLAQPTTLQQSLLQHFKYQVNTATVHTDTSVMPKNKKVWSSWNYRIDEVNGHLLPTTIYWMNRLQQVSENVDYFVSINAIPNSVAPQHLIKEIHYEHPLFDVAAVNAQADLHLLNETGPIYFCGSYFKYGFHEDAYTSAVQLSKILLSE